MSATFDQQGTYQLIFSVDGIESKLSDYIIVKEGYTKHQQTIRWLKTISFFCMLGVCIIANFMFTKPLLIVVAALSILFGYTIYTEPMEYYIIYYVMILLFLIFAIAFIVRVLKKHNFSNDPSIDSMCIQYTKRVFQSKCNEMATKSTDQNLRTEFIASSKSSKRNRVFRFVREMVSILTPYTHHKYAGNTEAPFVIPSRLLVGIVLSLFVLVFTLIKFANLYFIVSN